MKIYQYLCASAGQKVSLNVMSGVLGWWVGAPLLNLRTVGFHLGWVGWLVPEHALTVCSFCGSFCWCCASIVSAFAFVRSFVRSFVHCAHAHTHANTRTSRITYRHNNSQSKHSLTLTPPPSNHRSVGFHVLTFAFFVWSLARCNICACVRVRACVRWVNIVGYFPLERNQPTYQAVFTACGALKSQSRTHDATSFQQPAKHQQVATGRQ